MSWTSRSELGRGLAASVIGLAISACGDPTGPPDIGSLVYAVLVGCVPPFGGPFVCSPSVPEVTAGDSVWIGHVVVDTGSTHHADILIRPSCAVNFEIRRGAQLFGTIPAVPTCPDSVEVNGINAPHIENYRVYRWGVPPGLAPGTYTLRSVWLRDPMVFRSGAITIR